MQPSSQSEKTFAALENVITNVVHLYPGRRPLPETQVGLRSHFVAELKVSKGAPWPG